ncbi:hypothetical protein BV20DRAFT_1125466 [Pilatotrama ljubarskyi]|nr:hypothetical protein BV20DRAFT_1125466 [Pilatotrama ljubarskyi]
MKTQSKRNKPEGKQPYEMSGRKRGRAQPSAAASIPPSGSSPNSLTASALTSDPQSPAPVGAVPLRETCLEQIRKRYPGFQPRDDWDILQLGTGPPRKGTHQELYAWLDEWHAQCLEIDPQIDEGTKQVLDTRMETTRRKPKPGATGDPDELVYTRPIPDSKYSVRLFPGALDAAEYCMDFVETATGEPVNSPFEYELWNIPNPETPWLGMPIVGQLESIERAHGIKQEDILPGEEKFVLRDGQTCMLTRPEKRPIWFTVPIRARPVEHALEAMDKLDFPELAIRGRYTAKHISGRLQVVCAPESDLGAHILGR